jgi:uncharacterized membrane protein YcaP (DUF421 family)
MDIQQIFGSGEELTPLQMGARAFVMFFILLALIRIGGMRIFGQNTAFDNILVIMLGAVLARGVIGASPFWSTVAAAAVLIAVHKILAWLAVKSHVVGKIIKGEERSLYKNGQFNEGNMRASQISKHDVMEGVRKELNTDKLEKVKEAFLERDGAISVIEKEG